MQFVRAGIAIEDARIKFVFGYARDAWVQVEERSGFALDTRFIPAAEAVSADRICLFILLQGTWVLHGAGGRTLEGPCAFVVSEEQLEGANGARSCTFRSEGTPLTSIELHLRPAHVLSSSGDLAPLTLDDAAWTAARDVVAALDCEDAAVVSSERVPRLLRELERLQITTADAHVAVARSAPAPLARVLGAISRYVERMDLGGTLKDLEAATGTSQRQVARDIEAAVRMLGLAGLGWRLTSRHLRIKIAVILLSAEQASVTRVARIVGWGSADAMTRAFRNAGLPAPTVVQRALRD